MGSESLLRLVASRTALDTRHDDSYALSHPRLLAFLLLRGSPREEVEVVLGLFEFPERFRGVARLLPAVLVRVHEEAQPLERVRRRRVPGAVVRRVALLRGFDLAHERVLPRDALAHLPGGHAETHRPRHLPPPDLTLESKM